MSKKKEKVSLSNQNIAEYIFNDYVSTLEENDSDQIIKRLPALQDNNLACKISGYDFLESNFRVSTYRVFSKFITKYNKSLKSHRRQLLEHELGGDENVHARNDKRIIELSKYGLDEGIYYAELAESQYTIFIVEFDKDDSYVVNYTIWFVGDKWKKYRNKFNKMLNEYRAIKKEEKMETINYTNGKPSISSVFKPFDKVVFTKKKDIMKYIDNFIANIPEYYKFGMTPKLSIMIYGNPGTGKSTFAKALANYMNIPSVTCISADYFKSESEPQPTGRRGFSSGYSSRGGFRKTVFVLDDVDCVCKSREEDTSAENATIMANLLAFLDNPPTIDFMAKDGIKYPISIVVATTNYYNKLDAAVKRHGRFDLTIEMKEFGKEEAEEMCNIYNLTLSDVLPNEEWKKKNFVISPSTLQAMCLENIDKALKNAEK